MRIQRIKRLFQRRIIKKNISQILAITEKNIKLNIRFKGQLLFSYISPIITILFPIIIFQKLFELNTSLGPWTPETYAVFVVISYNLNLLRRTIGDFPNQLRREKFWKTFPAIIIAPFNRFNLLLGIFVSNLILFSIPFSLILIINYIIYPISFITFIVSLISYLMIALIFSGIGLILGIFAISNESIWHGISFMLNFIFWFSCISYPYDIFPGIIQAFINLNPLYYAFSFLRFTWIDDNIIFTISSNPIQFIIILGTSIIVPTVAVFIFNRVYRKFGIVGY
jgi:ABC-type polysaccharide/polyol phosphate export permease